MSGTSKEQEDPNSRPDPNLDEAAKRADRELDESLEETFPASDPPAIGGATGPND